jgi:hypothetical protein
MGWRYGRITGDFNPIHISRVLARLLGFERDLIHGMWSAARCLAHVPMPALDAPVQADLLFKGPVFMESTATMHAHTEGDTTCFDLFCDDNPRPCIRGRVMQTAPFSRLQGENG